MAGLGGYKPERWVTKRELMANVCHLGDVFLRGMAKVCHLE